MIFSALTSRMTGQLGVYAALSAAPGFGRTGGPPLLVAAAQSLSAFNNFVSSGQGRSRSAASTAAAVAPDTSGGSDQKAQISAPKYKAVTVDLFGTLLSEAIGEAKVYAMMMKRHGYPADEAEIEARYRVAYKRHKTNDTLRYVGDGKDFWRVVVMEAVDCQDPKVFEDIYTFYELPAAWKVSAGAFPAIRKMRRHGIKTAVVSDFDTRCRDLISSYGLDRAFDAIICSAEVGAEKPDPKIFQAACNKLGVEPHEVLHVGDSERRDLVGAKDFGFDALLWGIDLTCFHDLPDLVLPSPERAESHAQ